MRDGTEKCPTCGFDLADYYWWMGKFMSLVIGLIAFGALWYWWNHR